MRRNSPAFVIGASLLVGACSAGDRAATPTGPSEQPSNPSFATSTTTGAVCGNYPAKASTAIQQVLTELGYIYPRFSPPLVALQVVSNLLSVALAKAQQTQAQQFAVQIITRLQGDLKAGKLQNPPASNIGNPPFTTAAQVVDDLVKRLQCLTSLPVTGNDPNSGVGVVTPNTSSTIVTGSQTSGAFFPAGAVNNTTVITVQRLPNGPVLLTSLDQFPAFYEITSSNPNAQIVQQNQVIVGICNVANNDGYAGNTGNGNLLVAHNVGPNFGDVEVLPPATAGFLNCPPTPQISSAAAGPRNFAAASWRAVSHGLGSFAKTLFLPPELHATIMLGGGPGGYTGKFSPFGTVDINSNPAKLIIVDAAGNPAPSGVVTGEGPSYTIYVKTISSGAHYPGSYLSNAYTSPDSIPGVPVTFGETIVYTDAHGRASFNWTPSGANASLTATVPNEEGCPTAPTTPTIPAPGVPIAFRPPVCFTPRSVTFTVQAPPPPSFGASGWTYTFAGGTCTAGPSTPTSTTLFGQSVSLGTDPCLLSGITTPAGWPTADLATLTTWQNGTAPFGNVLPPDFVSPSGCPDDKATTSWAATTVLLLRRDFYVPTGTTSATIKISIDNDVQVYLNGTALTASANSFVIHDGCASTGTAYTFTVPVGQGGLQIGNNKLAVEALDRGGDTFFDAAITLNGPVNP